MRNGFIRRRIQYISFRVAGSRYSSVGMTDPLQLERNCGCSLGRGGGRGHGPPAGLSGRGSQRPAGGPGLALLAHQHQSVSGDTDRGHCQYTAQEEDEG